MLLKDASEQPVSVQIYFPLLDSGVNDFALRPSLPPVGGRWGITSISLLLDCGRPDARGGSQLSRRTLRGENRAVQGRTAVLLISGDCPPGGSPPPRQVP